MNTALLITQIILYIAIFLAMWRLIRGPRIMDRVMSLDGVAICVIGLLAVESMKFNSPYFIDLILVFSLFNFLSTVAYVFYLDKKYTPVNKFADPHTSLKEGRVLINGLKAIEPDALMPGEETEP